MFLRYSGRISANCAIKTIYLRNSKGSLKALQHAAHRAPMSNAFGAPQLLSRAFASPPPAKNPFDELPSSGSQKEAVDVGAFETAEDEATRPSQATASQPPRDDPFDKRLLLQKQKLHKILQKRKHGKRLTDKEALFLSDHLGQQGASATDDASQSQAGKTAEEREEERMEMIKLVRRVASEQVKTGARVNGQKYAVDRLLYDRKERRGSERSAAEVAASGAGDANGGQELQRSEVESEDQFGDVSEFKKSVKAADNLNERAARREMPDPGLV